LSFHPLIFFIINVPKQRIDSLFKGLNSQLIIILALVLALILTLALTLAIGLVFAFAISLICGSLALSLIGLISRTYLLSLFFLNDFPRLWAYNTQSNCLLRTLLLIRRSFLQLLHLKVSNQCLGSCVINKSLNGYPIGR
jgi:hypothetical protein